MWSKNKIRIEDETLDRFAPELMRAFEASETEVNTAATSPFLFRRIQVRIESEQRRRSEENNPWVALFVQVRRAIPVFALLAVAALITTLYLHSAKSQFAINGGSIADQQTTLVAGLPAFLQDSQEDVEASLVGWHGSPQGQRKE